MSFWSLPILLSHWLLSSSPLCMHQTTVDTLVSFTFRLHLAVVHLLVWSGVHCATAVGYGFRAAIACLEEACMMAAIHSLASLWVPCGGFVRVGASLLLLLFLLHSMCGLHSLASFRVPCVGFTLCSVCALLFSSLLHVLHVHACLHPVSSSLCFSMFCVLCVWASLIRMSLQCQTAVSDSPAYDLASRFSSRLQ